MEADRAEAIVLRVQPVTESSLLVTWFSREFGKLRTVAKGARRPKSPFRGKIDLFYGDAILFLRSQRSDLHLLQDCFLENPHAGLRGSVVTVTAAAYACELVDLATAEEDPNVGIFEALAALLETLTVAEAAVVLIWFELRLLAASGWLPRWEEGESVAKVLQALTAASAVAARRVRLTPGQVEAARALVWPELERELGRTPRARRLVLEQISGPRQFQR